MAIDSPAIAEWADAYIALQGDTQRALDAHPLFWAAERFMAPQRPGRAAAGRPSTHLTPATGVGIAAVVAQHQHERWLAENRSALDSANAFVERHGLPLARYRNF